MDKKVIVYYPVEKIDAVLERMENEGRHDEIFGLSVYTVLEDLSICVMLLENEGFDVSNMEEIKKRMRDKSDNSS